MRYYSQGHQLTIERINEARGHMSKIGGAWKKKTLRKYNVAINKQEAQLKMIKNQHG